MKKIILLFLLTFLSGCALFNPVDYEQELVGIWIYNHGPNELGYSIIEYQPNGDKCELSFQVDKKNRMKIYLYWNKWKVTDGIIMTTMHATNGGLKKDLEINDRILSFGKNHYVAIIDNYPEETWPEEHYIRNGRAIPGQVCNLVRPALLPMLK